MIALDSVETYQALTSEQRLQLAADLAESLGDPFQPHPRLLGSAKMIGLEHTPTRILFVAVPGGAFNMGLSELDIQEAKRYGDPDKVDRFLEHVGAPCLPAHRVEVAPFILTADILSRDQVIALSGGSQTFPSMDPEEAEAFRHHLPALRYPSEAEVEYVMREGGLVHFVNDGAKIFEATGTWPRTNGWGFAELTTNTWVADDWHNNYDGAPTTSAPWTASPLKSLEVFRGDLPDGPEWKDALVETLAALRSRYSDETENEVCVRLARSV